MPRHPIDLARNHYEKLPQPLKQALFSIDVAEKMVEIGKKFGLTVEKTGIMAEETGYVILGLGHPNELVGNLANELHVDAAKAKDIAAEISHQIFFPLREELKRTHDFDMDMSGIPQPADTSKVSGMQMPSAIKKTFVEEKSPLVSDLTRIKEQTTMPVPPRFSEPPAPKPLIAQPKEVPELKMSFAKDELPAKAEDKLEKSGAESWEKDMQKELSTLLSPEPSQPRTTPQLHDWSGFEDADKKVVSGVEPQAPPPTPSGVKAAVAPINSDPYREPVEE